MLSLLPGRAAALKQGSCRWTFSGSWLRGYQSQDLGHAEHDTSAIETPADVVTAKTEDVKKVSTRLCDELCHMKSCHHGIGSMHTITQTSPSWEGLGKTADAKVAVTAL